jgi:hypothetical protein
MSERHHQAQPVTSGDAKNLIKFRSAALELPEPGTEWAVANTDLDSGDIQRMKEVGAVVPTGWERVTVSKDYDTGSGNYERQTWRTVKDVYNWIQDNLTDISECPKRGCHATGISNPEGVDYYTCSNESCTVELSRAEAKELLQ